MAPLLVWSAAPSLSPEPLVRRGCQRHGSFAAFLKPVAYGVCVCVASQAKFNCYSEQNLLLTWLCVLLIQVSLTCYTGTQFAWAQHRQALHPLDGCDTV